MKDIQELQEFIRIMNAVSRVYPRLTGIAATEAVNFFKERFVLQQDVYGKPFKRRKSRKGVKDKGRAILVKRGILKRDIQKTYESPDLAIVGTSRITQGYAKAHNEGFSGTVIVKEHKRNRYVKVKERYTDKNGRERTRTSKQIEAKSKPIQVGTFYRKMNIPERRFMAKTPLLDARIEKVITNTYIKAIKSAL